VQVGGDDADAARRAAALALAAAAATPPPVPPAPPAPPLPPPSPPSPPDAPHGPAAAEAAAAAARAREKTLAGQIDRMLEKEFEDEAGACAPAHAHPHCAQPHLPQHSHRKNPSLTLHFFVIFSPKFPPFQRCGRRRGRNV
jgi:hypothetical protein